jgi:hypothetical protein
MHKGVSAVSPWSGSNVPIGNWKALDIVDVAMEKSMIGWMFEPA